MKVLQEPVRELSSGRGARRVDLVPAGDCRERENRPRRVWESMFTVTCTCSRAEICEGNTVVTN